mmetsp:Transcript_40879/g.95498  ORF Transcript_40879/g.95498 Transcript_40879/m.95498 type:complete len:525 (+) Transcript_40879:73-1647(+)
MLSYVVLASCILSVQAFGVPPAAMHKLGKARIASPASYILSCPLSRRIAQSRASFGPSFCGASAVRMSDAEAKHEQSVDVAVIGGGPAGLALSAALGERGVGVLCCDPALDEDWVPNYGVWMDEIEDYGMTHLCKSVWPKASVFMGGEGGGKRLLNRPYGQINTRKCKDWFIERCNKSNVKLGKSPVGSIKHSSEGSHISFKEGGTCVAKIVVDCTGHAKAFTEYNDGKDPGFQAAYGIGAEIEEGTYPFPIDEMMLMDFTDDHIQDGTPEKKESEELPTFIYCMPRDSKYVFFEETSLIANPPLQFEDLKRRMHKRLDSWGVKIKEVDEEEFCLIPMGGQFPVVPQRVIGFGGASAIVHPATGYMFAASLRLAVEIADAIKNALEEYPQDPEKMSEVVWGTLWSEQRIRQRDFQQFGGEYLEEIGLQELREFFGSFFKLPYQQWSEFLSMGLVEPLERLIFGLGVWAGTSNRVRLSLSLKGFLSGPEGWIRLGRSVLPVAEYDSKVLPTKDKRPAFFSEDKMT